MFRTVFSASADYFPAAAQELGAIFGDAAIERLGSETGGLAAAGVDIAEIATLCCRRPLFFVRHLMRELVRMPVEAAEEPDRIAVTAIEIARDHHVGSGVALQVWSDRVSPTNLRSDEIRRRVAERLSWHGIAVARANRDEILSVCLTPKGIVLGLNPRADALADWPGGRVSLAKDGGQISRAEFKLDELFKVFDVALPSGRVGLDLGASPGGWTRVLPRRGFTVWAIDLPELDPRIATDPGVHHVRTTAEPFLAKTDLVFDLVVCQWCFADRGDACVAPTNRPTRRMRGDAPLPVVGRGP